MKRNSWIFIATTALMLTSASRAADMGTAFTYQGSLENPPGTPVTDTCDFRLVLWDDPVGGSEIGNSPLTITSVAVTGGVFTLPDLDFGPDSINGTARWLHIAVKCGSDLTFVSLAPKVKLTPAPHALALPGLYTQQNAISPNLIGGCSGNTVTTGVFGATIGGGGEFAATNRVTDSYGTVGGGGLNQAGDAAGTTIDRMYATVGGGNFNIAGGSLSTVSGGVGNSASGYSATVPGGVSNTAAGYFSFAAGRQAKANHDSAFVWNDGLAGDFASTLPYQFLIRAAGGVGINTNTPTQALDVSGNIHASGTIASGSSITIDGTSGAERISSSASLDFRTAAGRALRLENNATSPNLIGGYSGNTVTPGAIGATIGGGGASANPNTVLANFGTVGGGFSNNASGSYSTVGGGFNNTTSALYSAVGGGESNTASGSDSTVGGGYSNTASGPWSTVPGGYSNEAGGDWSFAAGRQAKVRTPTQVGGGDIGGDEGTFIWADNGGTSFTSDGPNRFLVRASGGTKIYSNSGATIGVQLAAGGNSWSAISDRNVKENFKPLDGMDVLRRLSSVPITEWNLISQDCGIRHVGPMAQDFHAAFGLGEDERYISSSDADGVALAAIQGLHQLLQEKECVIDDQQSQVERQKAQIRELELRLARIEALLSDTSTKGAKP